MRRIEPAEHAARIDFDSLDEREVGACTRDPGHVRDACFLIDDAPACGQCAWEALVENIMEMRYAKSSERAFEWCQALYFQELFPSGIHEDTITDAIMLSLHRTIKSKFPHLVLGD